MKNKHEIPQHFNFIVASFSFLRFVHDFVIFRRRLHFFFSFNFINISLKFPSANHQSWHPFRELRIEIKIFAIDFNSSFWKCHLKTGAFMWIHYVEIVCNLLLKHCGWHYVYSSALAILIVRKLFNSIHFIQSRCVYRYANRSLFICSTQSFLFSVNLLFVKKLFEFFEFSSQSRCSTEINIIIIIIIL